MGRELLLRRNEPVDDCVCDTEKSADDEEQCDDKA